MTAARRRGAIGGTLALAAVLVAVAFVAKGGTDLARVTTASTWLILASGVVLAAAILAGRTERPHGVGPVLGFVLLAILTALSVLWSIAPDLSWIEANRTLTYVFVFAAAVASGNLLPGALRTVLGAITLAAVVIVAYALASRVFPGSLAELELYARLGQPFGYWNAVGVTAAIGFVGTTWLGSRREVRPALAALAAAAMALLVIALFLTYSRSALLAALIVLALWLAFVPLRLRTLVVLASAGIGAVPTIAWALSQDAFTEDGVALAVREEAADTFGLLLLLSVAIAYGLCLAALRWRERHAVRPPTRRAAGRAAVIAAAVLVLGGLGAVATTDRGLTGTISDRLDELTDDSASATGGPERLGTAASSRSRYWRAAGEVFDDHPVAGAGAGAFEVAYLRYRTGNLSRHAHGYFVQTLADLGILGLAFSLLAIGAWLLAGLRAVGATPRSALGQRFFLGDRRLDHARVPSWTDERVAVTALFLVALAYGLQSAADWTWFVPAPTVMALIAAGYVAGRPEPRAPADPRTAPRQPGVAHWRVGAAGAVCVAALVAAWSTWQPTRADTLVGDALSRAAGGDAPAALAKADDARDVNPVSPAPLWARAAAYTAAGRFDDAEGALEQAAAEHPNLAEAWLRLADFRLDRLNEPKTALDAVELALYLDPNSSAVRQSFIDIRDRFRSMGALPPETAAPPVE